MPRVELSTGNVDPEIQVRVFHDRNSFTFYLTSSFALYFLIG